MTDQKPNPEGIYTFMDCPDRKERKQGVPICRKQSNPYKYCLCLPDQCYRGYQR